MPESKKSSIKLTDKAITALKKQLADHKDATHIRLGLKAACKGFGYVILFESAPAKEKDTTFEFDGLYVIIDPKSLSMLDGLVVDWEETLMKQGPVFKNPNAVKGCGCGASFSTKKEGG